MCWKPVRLMVNSLGKEFHDQLLWYVSWLLSIFKSKLRKDLFNIFPGFWWFISIYGLLFFKATLLLFLLWLIFYHLCSSFGNTDFIHSRSVICIPPTFYFTFSYFYFYFLFRFLSPPCEFWEIFQNYLLYVVIFLFFSL